MIRTVASHSKVPFTQGTSPARDDDLRRVPRLAVCCRVDVRERHGVWSAVTEDVGTRGCRIVTPSFPRLGSRFAMSLSSDLFPQPLDVVAETVWATSSRLGVLFVETVLRKGALSPAEWLAHVLAHGHVPGSSPSALRVVPVMAARAARGRSGLPSPGAAPYRGTVASVPPHAQAAPSP